MNDIMYKLKKAILRWAADIRIYNLGFILYGDSSYRIKGPQMRSILNILQPGNVLLRRYDHYLGSILIKGYWSHAALYVGGNNVIHMLGEGITKEDILTFLRCDNICVLKAKNSELANNAVIRAYKLLEENVEYDFDFSSSNKKYYCTEFINYCFMNLIIPNSKNIIYPDDFLGCPIFRIVWFNPK